MNILILHGSSDLYGASKILLVIVAILKKNGHTPIVVLSEEGPLSEKLVEAKVEVIFVHLGILRRKYKSIPGILNRLVVLQKAYKAIKVLIREKNIDILYSNTTAVLVGAFVARNCHIKHIWHVHEIIEKPRLLYFLLGHLLNKYSDKVIVVSAAVKNHWSRYVADDKLKLIYNGIDYFPFLHSADLLRNELHPDNNCIIIGMIGRVHFWKGQDYFLQIAGILSKKYNNLLFVMVGDAFPGYEYLYETLNFIKKEENIAQLVYDLGYRTDIPSLLKGFDIFVLPSQLADPFPTVVLEAMASSKPVVATLQGGAVEMIENNRSGILIPINEPGKAALMMEKLIESKELRQKMGESGRKRVLTHFSKEAFENSIINLFR